MSVLKGRPGWRSSNGDHNAVNNLTVGLQQHAGLILGCGTSASTKSTTTADKNFLSFFLTSAATSGTSRGMYLRLYLTSNAGGEALRAFTTVSSNTPADTVNGAHISLSFGSSAGNVTGLGTAVRATLHIPNRALTGTCAALQAELYCDGTSSDVSGITSALRISVGGNATGYATIQSKVYFAHFDAGCVDATDGMIDSNRTSNTAGGCIKVYIDGVGERWITYGTGS
jgi:hypothetical protein